jgi:16S rRNA (cytosine967-C5)-methyltransferase
MSRVRALAVRVLRDAERRRAFVDDVLEEARGQALSARDRAFLTNLVYGATRMRLYLDAVIRKLSGVRDMDPQIRHALRVAFYELLILKSAPHAAVDEAVEIAKKVSVRSGKFVNAVLRKDPSGLRFERHVLASHPKWLVDRWAKRYDADAILAANNTVLPVTARVDGKPVVVEGDPREIRAAIQDATAMRVAPLVEGRVVVDLCASPGGKATHLAELGKRVVAVDLTLEKARLVRESASRLGLDVAPVVADGRRFGGRFDAALVDAPCSNTGVLARRADARWRLREEDLPKLAKLQRELLANAATLAPHIVYSTCSIEPEENEDVVDWFLKGRADWTCDHRELILPGPAAAGGFAARLRRQRG